MPEPGPPDQNADPQSHARPSPNSLESTVTAGEGRDEGQIGPYRLLQRIGTGGMGEVFEAEQERPVRRRVALKLIKLGMDTREVVARFESERQVLALLNHPYVAQASTRAPHRMAVPSS